MLVNLILIADFDRRSCHDGSVFPQIVEIFTSSQSDNGRFHTRDRLGRLSKYNDDVDNFEKQ